LFRIRKFISRGYKISAGQITKIAFDISKLDLTSPSVLHDQLIGVDYAYFAQVISLLIDPTKNADSAAAIDRTYLFKIIDQVYEGADSQPEPQLDPDQVEVEVDIDLYD
jgi:hypothetical protein